VGIALLFALWNYFQYRTRRGPYGNDLDKNAMAVGHYDRLPPDVVSMLDVGDLIFTQKLDSLTSWGVMYFTKSDSDHCANYVGNGYIIHMTLGGSRIDKLRVLYGDTRLLPVKLTFPDGGPAPGLRVDMTPEAIADWKKDPISDETVRLIRRTQVKHSSTEAKRRLYLVAVQIQLGMVPNTFDWRKFGDNVLTAATIVATFAPTSVMAYVFGATYAMFGPLWQLSFVVRRRLRMKLRPTTNVGSARRAMLARGGVAVPDWSKIDPATIKAAWRSPSSETG
jgi:hypothetical protein